MTNYKIDLDELDFHDSNIESIKIDDGDYFDRKLTIIIDYYNWEGNSESSTNWISKKLRLTINHCVHFQINAPNLMEDTFEIMATEFDIMYNEFIQKALDDREKSYFNNLKIKPLNNFLSIKFNTNNYADSLFNESAGFIWIAGFNVSHEWVEIKNVNKKHIAIK